MEKKLEQNRIQMTKEAKRAAKMEKRLKILTGGYQMRAQALIKQFQDLTDQLERTGMEKSTFEFLKDMENIAIPRRVDSLQEDLDRQKAREKDSQQRYSNAQFNLEQLKGQYENCNV
jgi:pre-mRNA-splicing factor CDC5/CEF1